MFELSRGIDEWRRGFANEGGLDREELDELQTHLMEAYESRVRNGMTGEEAFRSAAQQIGDPKTVSREYAKVPLVTSQKLWRAFRVAPLVAPILLALDTFVVAVLWSGPVAPRTPMGFLALPLLVLTLGLPVSYLVARVFFMPLVFCLRKRGWLHGGTIHGIAFLLGVAVFLLLETAVYFVAAERADFFEFLRMSLIVAGFVVPNIMLSALVFWWMIRDGSNRLEVFEAAPPIAD